MIKTLSEWRKLAELDLWDNEGWARVRQCDDCQEALKEACDKLAIAVETLTRFATMHDSGKWCVENCSCPGAVCREALAKIEGMK